MSGDDSWTLTSNTFYLGFDDGDKSLTMSGNNWRIINNAFVYDGAPLDTHYAIKEGDDTADPRMVRNNAFIGFDGPYGVYYMEEGTTPITNIIQLNIMSSLPSCGRGENIAISDLASAGFVSIDPGNPDFLMPTLASPVVDAGLDLPFSCEGTNSVPATDKNGTPRPQGDHWDIGCYEAQ